MVALPSIRSYESAAQFCEGISPPPRGYFRFIAARISRDFRDVLLYSRNWEVLPQGETRRAGSRHSGGGQRFGRAPFAELVGPLKYRILAQGQECGRKRSRKSLWLTRIDLNHL